MILYLDTSTLLKKYFQETGSDEITARWKEATGIVTSYDNKLLQAAQTAGLQTLPGYSGSKLE